MLVFFHKFGLMHSRNSLSAAMISQLTTAVVRAGDDPTVRTVIIAAAAPVFSAGHDLRELLPSPETFFSGQNNLSASEIFSACAELMLVIRGLPIPVVGSVSGLSFPASTSYFILLFLILFTNSRGSCSSLRRPCHGCWLPACSHLRCHGGRCELKIRNTGASCWPLLLNSGRGSGACDVAKAGPSHASDGRCHHRARFVALDFKHSNHI
jgi:hypothetical protein